MKKIIVMLSLGVLIAGTALAQNAPRKERNSRIENRDQRRVHQKKTPAERAAKQTEVLSQKLDLSARQKRKVEALNLKHNQEMEALRSKNNIATRRNKAQREEVRRLRAEREEALKDILNKKQYAKYEADRKELRNRRDMDGRERTREQKRRNS